MDLTIADDCKNWRQIQAVCMKFKMANAPCITIQLQTESVLLELLNPHEEAVIDVTKTMVRPTPRSRSRAGTELQEVLQNGGPVKKIRFYSCNNPAGTLLAFTQTFA